MMQTTAIRPVSRAPVLKQPQRYRVSRQFSSPRRLKELVRDLLRAHSGE